MPDKNLMTPRTHRFTVKKSEFGIEAHEIVFTDWGPVDAVIPVICVHGLTRNAGDFNWLAPALAALGRRVIAISMAGRGESARLTDSMHYNYATYVADCLSIMDNFHWRTVDWIGTSMGGIIGMTIASLQRDRIRKLVLNDIGAILKKSALERIFANVNSIPSSFTSRAEAEAYMRKTYAPFGLSSEEQWQNFFAISLQEIDGTLRLACDPRIIDPIARDTKNFTEIADVNLSELWKTIRIPTLILRGEQSDILDADTVTAMRTTNLDAELVTIPNVGHAPALMDASQIKMVTDWLAGAASPIRMAGM
jgi:pimeloyl-ACP methyl ester carboxylesterase